MVPDSQNYFEEIFSTSQAKVLRFLARHGDCSLYEGEIQKGTGVSRSAVNLATRSLYQKGLLQRQQRGRMFFYRVVEKHPFIRQFKVLDTIAELESLLIELRALSERVILFGSCAKGEDMPDSDIDLFVLTKEREKVMTTLRHYQQNSKQIQAIVVDYPELIRLKENDPYFYAQIEQGILLWENQNDLGT